MHRTTQFTGALSFALLTLQAAGSTAPMPVKQSAEPITRLIVKFANGPQKSASVPNTAQRITAMALQAGVGMHVTRALSGGAQLVNVDHSMTPEELTEMAQRLSSQPGVEYAEPDVRLYPMLTPNDPQFAAQYYLKDASVVPAAINAPAAWDITTGSESVTVAVLDTGIRPEQFGIGARLVPGYDFISADPDGSFFDANDGDGRDRNPADPGDEVAAGACGANIPPLMQPSSWHGTRVASLIGAVTNDGQGMAGVDWSAHILPVRVLGRCGAFLSDFIDAGRWAAGLPVPGAPTNLNPADIINLSFGAMSVCTQATQAAIDDVVAAGTLVVAAAGNNSTNALRTTPANCTGVVPVAATTPSGALAEFSNVGAKVALAAPGVAILTAANRGTKVPIPNGKIYSDADGTSFSSPLVAGVASLMLSLNSNLTPQQLLGTLRANARAFPAPPTGTPCDSPMCGAGLLDAAAAVRAVATGNIAAAIDGGDGLRAAFARAIPLMMAAPRRGSLTEPSAFDVYKITLPASGHLRVATAGRTDTYGYLLNASGRLMGQDDDITPPVGNSIIAANPNFRIDALLPRGTYYVAVEGFSQRTLGSYRVSANLISQSAASRGAGG